MDGLTDEIKDSVRKSAEASGEGLSLSEQSAYRFLFCNSKKSIIAAMVILLAFTGLLAGLRWYTGSLPLADESGARDSIFLLDQANRVASGQRPHVDFISPLGVLQYMLMHLGVLICGVRGAALTAGYLAFLPLLFAGTFIICAKRLAILPAGILTLANVAMLLGATALGGVFSLSSYETMYNRVGFAIVSPLFIAALLPVKNKLGFFDGVCVGLLFGCAIFLKINFALGAAALLIFGMVLKNIKLKNLPSISVGSLLVAVAVAVYLRGNLVAYFADMFRLMGHSGGNALTITAGKVWYQISDIRLLLVALCALLYIHSARAGGIGLRKIAANILIFAIAVGIVFFIMLACARLDGFMISYVIIFVIFGYIAVPTGNAPAWRALTAGLLGYVCAASFIIVQTQSIMTAMRNVIMMDRSQKEYALLGNPSLSDMRFILKGTSIAEDLGNGVSLLEKNSVPKDSVVFSFSMFNSWPLLYGSANRAGDWAFLNYGGIFSDDYLPTRDELFKSVDVLLLQKDDPYTKKIMDANPGYIGQNYYLKDENSNWVLYLKKPAESSQHSEVK